MMCLPLTAYGDASGAFRLEGILYDRANPDETVVVIDGQPFKKGDSYGQFRIETVDENAIEVINLGTREKSRLEVVGEGDSGPETGADRVEVPLPLPPAAPEVWYEMWVREAVRWWEIHNPFKSEAPSEEDAVIAGLTIVHRAVLTYYLDRKIYPAALEELTAHGYLNAEFDQAVKGIYRYYLEIHKDLFLVHADPVIPGSGLRYFLMNKRGELRAETGSPATIESQPYIFSS